jgi:SH3 domain protein
MNMHTVSLLAAVTLLASAATQAEQLYVLDKLVLNVYAEANQDSERIETIETGDAVEEIERVDNFVRVRLEDGREGWVGANYVSTQPPAIIRLKELQATQSEAGAGPPPTQLTEEIARLKKQNASLTTEVTDLKKKAAAAAQSAAAIPAAAPAMNVAAAPASNAPNEVAEPVKRESAVVVQKSYWWAWLLAVCAAGGAGFFAGYQTLGHRVRERFGGVKVY